MSVKLVTITPDTESVILYIARASSDQSNTDVGLLRFMLREGHWSPFMMAHAVIEVVTARAISHQIIRHWTLACLESGEPPGLQEFSQRYAEVPDILIYRGRRRGATNRQSSIDDMPEEDQQWWAEGQRDLYEHAEALYAEAIARGFAYESARMALPEAAQTKLYLAGSVRSWITYLSGRCADDAQLEHQQLACEARDLLASHLPTVAESVGWVSA